MNAKFLNGQVTQLILLIKIIFNFLNILLLMAQLLTYF